MSQRKKQHSPKSKTSPTSKPDAYATHLSQALAAHQQGNIADAERGYTFILSQNPHHFDALHYLGIVKMQQGNAAHGIELIEAALKIQPNSADALANLGSLLFTAQRPAEALARLDHTLRLNPQQASAHTNRGLALAALKRFDEAVAAHERALKLHPDFLEALNNYGNALRALGRYDDALAAYDKTLKLRPNYTMALNNRGLALSALKRCDEAIASYDKALELNPNYAEAHNNRGNALKELGNFDSAFAAHAQALVLKPDYAEAMYNRGNTFGALNRHGEALICYDSALTMQPTHVDANWNKALSHLLLGQMREGWAQYAWRWQLKGADKPREFDCPEWQDTSQSLVGKRIVLWAEQGLGDTLQFCRYASVLAQRGAEVVLEVQAPLTRLLKSVPGVSAVIARGEVVPPTDFHCPLLSLPQALQEDMPPTTGRYLDVPAEALTAWQSNIEKRIGSNERKRLRVGISCSGNPKLANDHNRSIPLAKFAPLLELDIELFLIQKDCREADEVFLQANPQIHDLRSELNDFVDTAAAMMQIDLIISVDTSVAHLAGALNCPLWVLLPFAPDWRWQLSRTDSPWYPSAHLWRQNIVGDWANVIERITLALKEQISKRSS